MNDFTEQLNDLGACKKAIEWVNGRSLRKCWQVCDRADWMLWLANTLIIDRKLLVMVACDCAETAQKYADDGGISANAIKVARDLCEGRATMEEARKAAGAAYYADEAAYYAAYAATYPAHAASAAEAAANAAYGTHTALKKMAALVRKRIPVEAIEKALQETGSD